jgi:hypothetical protein
MLRKGKQSWFTCGNRCFILVTNLMTSHEWGKDRENISWFVYSVFSLLVYSWLCNEILLFTNISKIVPKKLYQSTILMVYHLFTLQNSHKPVKTKIIFFCLFLSTLFDFQICSQMAKFNKNVDIKFSPHAAFLE